MREAASLPLRQMLAVRLRAGTITRVLESIAWVRHKLPDSRAARARLRITRGLTYGPLPEQKLDIYCPHAAKGTVVYVHGGGFSMLSRKTHEGMALRYAAMGYAVVCIDYRLAPKHRYPAQLNDAALAIEYVQTHANQLGIPVSPLVLAGESAGGNLVAALALSAVTDSDSPFAKRMAALAPSLAAVVSSYGYHDAVAASEYVAQRAREQPHKAPVHANVEGQLMRTAEVYVGLDIRASLTQLPYANPLPLLESSISLVRTHPPMLLDCGTRDPLLGQTKRYAKALAARGIAHELLVYPGELHAYDAFPWRPAAKQKWAAVEAFLTKTLAAK